MHAGANGVDIPADVFLGGRDDVIFSRSPPRTVHIYLAFPLRLVQLDTVVWWNGRAAIDADVIALDWLDFRGSD